MWSNQTGVLGLGHSVCFGRYASGARLATVWSIWKGMLVLRQCGHAQNAMVSLRVNPGKQKLLVKWWTLAACPWRPRSPAGKWPKHAPALHPFALVSTRRNTRDQARWKQLDLGQGLTQMARGKRLETAWWSSVEVQPALTHFYVQKGQSCHSSRPSTEHQNDDLGHVLKHWFTSLAVICTVK